MKKLDFDSKGQVMNTFTVCNENREILRVNHNAVAANSMWLCEPDSVTRIKTYLIHPERISTKNVFAFLESRVIPRDREDVDYWLDIWNLAVWNPYAICKVTHAISPQDFIWIKFHGEDICYDDVRFR